MAPISRTLWYTLAVLVVALLGGLSGWYFYLRSHETAIQSVDAARGLGGAPLVYEGSFGSAQPVATSSAALPSAQPQLAQRLWRVDIGPVAGFAFLEEKTGTSSQSYLYFAERGNAYIFAGDAGKEAVERITDTLLPKTYTAAFAPEAGTVILRSLDNAGHITAQRGGFAPLGATTTFPQALLTSPLPSGIDALTWNGADLFYLTPQTGGGTTGSLLAPGKTAKTIFSSFLSGWLPESGNGKLVLTQKAADGIPGYAYTLTASGALAPLLGPLPGLEVLPHPSESALLFSTASGGRLALFAQVGSGKPVSLPVATVAEKCAWAPGLPLIAYCAVPSSLPAGGFLGPWYRGEYHSSDSWWQIDIASGAANEMYSPAQALDVHDPAIDPSGTYIAFSNGADRSLWVLRVVQ